MDELLPWLRRSGWAYVAAAVVLALAAWRVAGDGGGGGGGGGGQPARAAASVPVDASAPSAPRGLVHVAGAVRRPGVYPVSPGARVIAVIHRAGGPTRKADMSGLNLAATVQDGQQVIVPTRAPAGGAAGSAAGAAGKGPVSLSSADEAALDGLDGIGPTLAARIVEWRIAHGGFASVDQLLEVPGIGPTRLESLRSQVVP